MPSATVRGFPFPLPSDPLGDADAHIEALATFLNNFVRGDTATVNLVASTTGFVDVNFAVPYAAAPRVVATSTNAHYICGITNVTLTSFRLTVQRRDSTNLTAGVVCYWMALPQ